jgi:hypothetical protein
MDRTRIGRTAPIKQSDNVWCHCPWTFHHEYLLSLGLTNSLLPFERFLYSVNEEISYSRLIALFGWLFEISLTYPIPL